MSDKQKTDHAILAQPLDKTKIPEAKFPNPAQEDTGYSFLKSTHDGDAELDLRGVALNFN
ncbi:hypothetical protein [Brucella intermedia]|uniref:hypothetical protein n=1 Tax=Brucella intermedia TaxID=94625 RepID=UPI00158971C8|nr:hypothetical protein [Brucella intermedia]